MVNHSELELHVGDVVVLGDQTLTVVDVEGGEIAFRLDPLARCDGSSEINVEQAGETMHIRTPSNPRYRRYAR